MTQADRVLSTPPTNTPIDTSRRRFLAQAAAVAATGGALGMTLPLPAPAGASEPTPDPIFTAIEMHRTARSEFLEAVSRNCKLDVELPNELSQSKITVWGEEIVETDDPRWIASEREVRRTTEAMDVSALDLLDIRPTTTAGLMALLSYVVAVEKEGDGDLAWPQALVDGEDQTKLARNWACYLHASLADSLQAIVDGVQA